MLKLKNGENGVVVKFQPPSGGCVLKHPQKFLKKLVMLPAAFRRLCVETAVTEDVTQPAGYPAAFRRLCVETVICSRDWQRVSPAAFRRLCVETINGINGKTN